MQRKSIGQLRRKQGEQGAFDFNKRCRESPGNPGPVNSGDVLPNGTTTGVPRAAATCIGPESFVSRTRESLRRDIRSRRLPSPALFRIRVFAREITFSQKPESFADPIVIQTAL